MKIDKTIKTPAGTVVFQGEVSEAEYEQIVNAGLMYLMSEGLIEATTISLEVDDSTELPEGTTLQ